MRRFDFGGGIWLRVGRWWMGLVASFPFVARVPVIAGASEAMPAQGSYLLIGVGGDEGSPESLVEIGEVREISGGGGTAEQIDVTHLRSPNRRREFKPSFIDDGTLTWTMSYLPNDPGQLRVQALFNSGADVALREVFPDGNGWDYTGFVQGYVKSGQAVGGVLSINVTFKMSSGTDFTGIGSPV